MKVKSIPAFQKATMPNTSKKETELCPEAYLDEPPFTIPEVIQTIDKSIRENLAVSNPDSNILAFVGFS